VNLKERVQEGLEITGAWLTAIVTIYIAILVLAIIDWGFLKSEITNYIVECSEPPRLGVCKNVKYGLRPTTYKVMPDRQEVVHWTQGFAPERLTKCAVRDRKNWSCKYNDESAEFGFNGGSYWERTLKRGLLDPSTHTTVPRWEWLNQRCEDSALPFLICIPVISFLDS
jgi:hypothetical protein